MSKLDWINNIHPIYKKIIAKQRTKSIYWSFSLFDAKESVIKNRPNPYIVITRLFPWIKIVHYFDSDLNETEIANRNKRVLIEGTIVVWVKNIQGQLVKLELGDDFFTIHWRWGHIKKSLIHILISVDANLFSSQISIGVDEDFPDGIFHNEECARMNQPMLEKSLRAIEKELGLEFDECFAEASVNKPLIWKYGFKSEEQMKAEGLWRE